MNLPFPVAASVRHSPVLTPHFAVLILSLSLSAVVADERYRAAKHTAQGASSNDGGGSSTANYYYFIRRNRVRSNGLPLPRSTHWPDIRFFAAPGPPADGMSPGRAACPRIAIRVPRCVVLTSKAVPGLKFFFCGCVWTGVLAAIVWFPLGIGLCLLDRRVRCQRCGESLEDGLCS